MSEDVLHRLGHALAVSYDNMIPEPLSEKLRDRVLELAVAEAVADGTPSRFHRKTGLSGLDM